MESNKTASIKGTMSWIAGIHPVREALAAGRPLDRVLIANETRSPRLREIIELCHQRGVPVRFEPRQALDRLAKGTPHQGVMASGAAEKYVELAQLIAGAGLLVALDGIEDPHNAGAIIRTAHACGASGIILPERRAAGLTEVVAKASAGAISLIPVARVTNLNRALEELKRSNFWIYGLDERGVSIYSTPEFASPTVFVLGAEGKGLHQQTKAHCDALLSIPMAGQIASLNVSVAAGVVLFEWRRRRG